MVVRWLNAKRFKGYEHPSYIKAPYCIFWLKLSSFFNVLLYFICLSCVSCFSSCNAAFLGFFNKFWDDVFFILHLIKIVDVHIKYNQSGRCLSIAVQTLIIPTMAHCCLNGGGIKPVHIIHRINWGSVPRSSIRQRRIILNCAKLLCLNEHNVSTLSEVVWSSEAICGEKMISPKHTGWRYTAPVLGCAQHSAMQQRSTFNGLFVLSYRPSCSALLCSLQNVNTKGI